MMSCMSKKRPESLPFEAPEHILAVRYSRNYNRENPVGFL